MAKPTNIATAKQAAQPVTTDLSVNYSTRTWNTRERNPNDEWDRADTASEHTLHSIAIASKSSYSTVTYPGIIQPGDKVYLLYAVYSTGDSFGHDDARCLELISVHKDLDVARWNHQKVEASQNDDYMTQLVLSQDNGQTWKMNPPWCGYFERLSYARVAGFTVLPEGANATSGGMDSWYDEIN